MRILVVNTYDAGGGAEKAAYDLFTGYRNAGHNVRMLVKFRKTSDRDVLEIDRFCGARGASYLALADRVIKNMPRFKGFYRVRDWLAMHAYGVRYREWRQGIDNYSFRNPAEMLRIQEWQPDVIHLHNVHGGYFDIRALSGLSSNVPVVWTLHDTWAITGHCAYFIDCDKWKTGCGKCPDLGRPPAIRADGTAISWRQKDDVYRKSRISVAVPSRWLAGIVGVSIMKEFPMKVIPYGLDLTIFRPGSKTVARAHLGLPEDAFICLSCVFSAATANIYKDTDTVLKALTILKSRNNDAKVLLVMAGGANSRDSQGWVRHMGVVGEAKIMALCYQAADVMLHAASADNYPFAVLESLACGTPVIATNTGGVAEQIVSGKTGYLVNKADSAEMAAKVERLLGDRTALNEMSRQCLKWTEQNTSLDCSIKQYVQWFEQLIHEPR